MDRRHPAGLRRADRLGLHRRHRRHHQLFRRAVRAADRGREQRAVPPRRDDDRDAQRAAVRRHRADAVFRAGRPARRAVSRSRGRAAAAPHRRVHDRPQRVSVLLDRVSQRLARRSPAARRRAARARVERDRRSSGVQPARHRQPGERARDDRSAGAHPDVQPRGRSDHRPSALSRSSAGASKRCSSCRRTWPASSAVSSEPVARPPHRDVRIAPATDGRSISDSPRRRFRRRAATPACCSRFRTSPTSRSSSATRGCGSGSRRSARWRPASRTKFAIRSRRCRDRFRFCGRSFRSPRSRRS